MQCLNGATGQNFLFVQVNQIMASKQSAVVSLITLYIEWINLNQGLHYKLEQLISVDVIIAHELNNKILTRYHLYVPHLISNTLELSLFIRMHSFGSNNIDLINVVLSDRYKYLGKSLLGCIWQDMFFLLHPVGF